MEKRAALLDVLGGEAGCQRLSAAFYARVGKDPVLGPLFPGKSLRCAIEEFAAFLIQFLGGDEEETQDRWWLSLRESHARFQIGPAERRAWLTHMGATLDATALDVATRNALRQFFEHSSAYVVGDEVGPPAHDELAARWGEQRVLDDAIAAIVAGRDREAIALAPQVSVPAGGVRGAAGADGPTGRADLIGFVMEAVERDTRLCRRAVMGGARSSITHLARVASRWSQRCSGSAWTPTSKQRAAIRRSTAWRTNARRKRDRRSCARSCERALM